MSSAPARKRDPLQQSVNLAGRRLGRYEVLCQLASGGMAAVYVARAQGLAGFERLAAIKVLHPHLAHEEEFTSMFLDEARLAARIRHPNVVGTLDVSDSEGDGYFIVMEYIEGHHLGALIQEAVKAGEVLPAEVSLRIVVDACAGLGAAHALRDERGQPLNLVHRDVSPHNVVVGVDGVARLTDFGVAKAEVRLSSTREGQFKGKLAYMAPEQAAAGVTDQRSDLFAMGVLLWESLTGKRLFRGENNAATLNMVLVEPIPAPSKVRPELAPIDDVLAKALAREPSERFQTAGELADAIEGVAPQLGGIARAREVSAVVRRYAGEKLEREAGRIQQAIDQLGRGGVPLSRIPPPRDGIDPDQRARSLEETVADDLGNRPARPRSRGVVAIATGLVVIAVALGAYQAWRSTRERPTSEHGVGSGPTSVRAPPATPAPAPAPAPTAAAAPAPPAPPAPAIVPDAGAATRVTRSTRSRHHRGDRPSSGAAQQPPREREDTTSEDPIANPYRR